MPYRNDEVARQDKLAELENELARVRGQMRLQVDLRAREAELKRQVVLAKDGVSNARRRRALPLLNTVTVASPCEATWDDMVGDDRVRFCGGCKKNVYDLSAMTSREAEALLVEHGEAACIRFYRRADGTILTQDCPTGLRRKRIRRFVAAAAVGGGSLLALSASTTSGRSAEVAPSEAHEEASPAVASAPAPEPMPEPEPEPERSAHRHRMGKGSFRSAEDVRAQLRTEAITAIRSIRVLKK